MVRANEAVDDGMSQRWKHIGSDLRKQARFAAVLLSALILCTPQPAFACLCRGVRRPPCVAFQEATAVFSGPVTEIANAPCEQGDTFNYLLIHFSIEQTYKGASAAQVTVATITGTDCDFGFQKGETYFVYAYQDSKHDRLVTGVCTRTKKLSYAKEDVSYAEGLSTSTPETSILGADDEFSSLFGGAEIIIEGQGKRYEAVADERGAFKVKLAQSGRYKVTVVGSSGCVFLNHHNSWKVFSLNGRPAVEFEREVSEGRCEFVDFSEYLTVRKN